MVELHFKGLREDIHKGGGVNPLDHKAKKHFFVPINGENSTQELGEKKIVKIHFRLLILKLKKSGMDH